MDETTKKKEIYEYTAPWLIYGVSCSVREDKPFRLAISSFIEEYANRVEVVELNESVGEFKKTGDFSHPYPATKIMFVPDKSTNVPDLIATTGDYLRLWNVQDDGSIRMKCLLDTNKNSEFCAPLTSFDWNSTDSNILGTSSIDTTCTIWDLQESKPKTQLIAHDREVYDIAFGNGKDMFASVGGDGSVRLFDLRALDHSTVIFEMPDMKPLLRLSWNKRDDNYLATMPMDSSRVIILDRRIPALPVAELDGHGACVNSVAWAPHSSYHICTVGDDCQALIWDLSSLPKPVEDPILAYNAEGEVNQLQWSALQPDWVAIAVAQKMQILRV